MRIGWEKWLKYGQDDLAAAKYMFENQKYRHAAYLTQQALEKHVKSLWVAGGMENPELLGHDIVGYWVSQITKNLGEVEFGNKGLSKTEFKRVMKNLKKITKDMKCNNGLKDDIWMYSLGIYRSKSSQCLRNHVSEAERFFEKFSGVGDMDVIATRAKNRSHSYANGNIGDKAKIPSTAALATIPITKWILVTYPHSTYDRYPMFVKCDDGEKNVADLYVEYKTGLEILMNDVSDACTYLSIVAENLNTACRK